MAEEQASKSERHVNAMLDAHFAYQDECEQKEALIKATSPPENYAYRCACAGYDATVDGGYPASYCQKEWDRVIAAFNNLPEKEKWSLPRRRH